MHPSDAGSSARACTLQNPVLLMNQFRIALKLHRKWLIPRQRALNFVNAGQGYRTVKDGGRSRGLVRNFDPRVAWSVALDHCEQRRSMRGVQPDAAMRRRSAEPR